jgi:hypothetical protein
MRYRIWLSAFVALALFIDAPPRQGADGLLPQAHAQPFNFDIGPNWVSLGPSPILPAGIISSQDVLSPPLSGRATVMAVNPKNRYNIWLGTAGGGLWITNNDKIGGLDASKIKPDPSGANFDRDWQPRWFPHNDGFGSLSIGGIVLDPSSCTASGCLRAYVGTGENSLRRDTYYGDGVYRVEYGGPAEFKQWSWTRLDTNKQFRYGSTAGLVVDKNELFVALSAGNTTTSVYATVRAPEPVAGYGVHRRDSSGNWTRVFSTTSHGKERWADLLLPTDIEKDPSGPDAFLLGVMNDGIFRTNDRGQTWCALNPGSRLLQASQSGQIPTVITDCSAGTGLPSAGTFDHVELAVESAGRLYVVFGNCPSGYTEATQGATSLCRDGLTDRTPFFYKSTDGGKSWVQPFPIPGAHYSRYTHALVAVGGEQLLWGGLQPHLLNTSGSNTGATNLRHASLHYDVHALAGYAGWDQGSEVLYAATDGGFYFMVGGLPGAPWVARNDSLITTAFVNIALDYEDEPGDGFPRTTAILGGLQDNSNAAYNGSEKWLLWGPVGDGGEALIQTPTITYDSIQDNAIRRIPGFNSFSAGVAGTRVNNQEDVSFYSVLAQHEQTKRVFVATDVVSVRDGMPSFWSAGVPPADTISPVFGTDGHDFPAIETDRDLITAIAIAPSHGWRVYVGLYSGQVWRSTTSPAQRPTASDWIRIDNGQLPPGPISSIAVHPTDENRLWVTFSNFVDQTVWYSEHAGQSWQPRSGGLTAKEPAKVIKVVPNEPAKLWLGTDTGVFLSADSGLTWEARKANLPTVPVFDVEVDHHNGRVFAATHGRGVWMLNDKGPVLTTFEGWMEQGIWDIPIYGIGFSCSQSGGCNCTVEVEREDGTVCASGNVDAIGNRIFVPQGDHTLRTENMGSCTRCDGKPVVFACFNGNCVGGTKLSACNAGGHRVSAVRVKCVDNPEVTGSVAGSCPVQSNPPSNVFEVAPALTVPGVANPGSGSSGLPGPSPQPSAGVVTLSLTPTVLAPTVNGGDRALCSALAQFDPSDADQAQISFRDAINSSASCQAAGITASLVQTTPLKGEDTPKKPDHRLALSAPGITASQMILGIAALPGEAAGLCFDMSRLGVYLANQIAVTQMRFTTDTAGAAGGEVVVSEVSPVGQCTMRIPTLPGQSGEQIAQAVAQAFQTLGVPSPRTCPEGNNPNDIVKDGDSVVAVLPTSVRACILDEGVGFTFGPHGIDVSAVPLKYEYAAKIVCGVQKDTKDMRLARGFYATSINVHNASASKATLFKKLALTYPPSKQAPGKVFSIGTDRLGPGEALKADCMDIQLRLFRDGFPTPYIEGWVVVQSTDHLDVAGVYTTATLNAEHTAEHHSSMHVQPIAEREIERKPRREPKKPDGEIPDTALVCYQVEASEKPEAEISIRTQFGQHRRVPLSKLALVCEKVFKAHEEAKIPNLPPPLLPLTCYGIAGEPVGRRVELADRNGFFSGTVSVGRPEIFCDPAKKEEWRGQSSPELGSFGAPLTGYEISASTLPKPATVFTRGRFGARKLRFQKSTVLLEPSTKGNLEAPLPEEPPLHCYRVEGSQPVNEALVLVDQFGVHKVRVGAPQFFCDPATKTLRTSSGLPTYYTYDGASLGTLQAQVPTGEITLAELQQWDETMFDLVKTRKLAPTAASRIFAYVLSAQADAANLSRTVHGEYAGSVGRLTAKILCIFFPEDCSQLLRGRANDPYSQALTNVVLTQVQARVIAESSPKSPRTRKTGDRYWWGDNPTTPDAGAWKPWLIGRPDQFRAPRPPDYGSAEDLREVERVKTAISNRTPEQQKAVLFWAGGPGTETPAGIWLRIAGDYLQTSRAPLELVLRVRATLAMTMADAFIACWDTKYSYWTQRPFMRDPAIQSSIPTPNFPSYTSGHATASAAAATVLSRFFPQNAGRWIALAEEAKDSRLWSGIHFPVDNDRGFLMGKTLAEYTLQRP